MYAGELEKHINTNDYEIIGYDDFLSVFKVNKSKSALSSEQLAQRRDRRKQSLKNLEDKVKSYGGIEGIGRSLSNVASLFKGNANKVDQGRKSPAYNISLGDQPEPKSNKYQPLIILGGVLAGVGIIWLIAHKTGNSNAIKNT